MASKKRKLIKEKERLLTLQNKYQEGQKMVWEVIVVVVVAVILLIGCGVWVSEGFDELKKVLSPAIPILVPATCAIPIAIYYLTLCKTKIRDLGEEIKEIEQEINLYTEH